MVSDGTSRTSSDAGVRVAAPLPVGARLLHIGQPKTATTTLQLAASSQRSRLAELGVCYPGRASNHNLAVSALMGRRSPAWPTAPDIGRWQELLEEVRSRPGARALVSYELMTQSDDDAARRFAAELGPDTYVVITVRSFAAMLPSIWQQYVKGGQAVTYEDWLDTVLDPVTEAPSSGPGFWPEHDLVAQVRRWTAAVGDDHVIVVVLDKLRPELVTEAFEGLLDLPPGTLEVAGEDGRGANRGLSLLESDLVLRLNGALRRHRWKATDYYTLVRDGAVAAVQLERRPGPDEGRPGVPARNAERVDRVAHGFVSVLADEPVVVVGDVAGLMRPASAPVAPTSSPAVEREIAVAALRGLVARSTGRGADVTAPAPERPRAAGSRPGATGSRPGGPGGRDVLHVDLSAVRVADRLRPPAGPSLPGEHLACGARVVATAEGGRWVVADATALADGEARAGLLRQLNRPRVVVTVDTDPVAASVALWEETLALGEARAFEAWRAEGGTAPARALRRLRRAFRSVEVVEVAADHADAAVLEQLRRRFPAGLDLGLDPRRRRALTSIEAELLVALNASLAGADLSPVERRTMVGFGFLDGMRLIRPAADDVLGAATRALAGGYSVAVGRGVAFEGAAADASRIAWTRSAPVPPRPRRSRAVVGRAVRRIRPSR